MNEILRAILQSIKHTRTHGWGEIKTACIHLPDGYASLSFIDNPDDGAQKLWIRYSTNSWQRVRDKTYALEDPDLLEKVNHDLDNYQGLNTKYWNEDDILWPKAPITG